MVCLSNNLTPKTKLKLEKNIQNNVEHLERCLELPENNKIFRNLPPILFEYQQEFLKAAKSLKNKILVWEKSRRIGATHALAAFAVLESAKQDKPVNFFYIGTSLAMAREFLESCAYWAKAFNLASSKIKESLYKSEKDDIQVLRINFNSGKKIVALSSKPSSIRGLQGHVLIDEAAFLINLAEFLKAVKSMLIWGCKVFVISTHNGINNEFNELCESINKGVEKYYKQVTTFKDAVIQGLYKRICLMIGETWTNSKEDEWVKDIYQQYGNGASEELDVIPNVSNTNSIFKGDWFKKINRNDLPARFDYLAYAWDFAATDKNDSCFTAGILMAKYREDFYILNWKYCRKDAKSTQTFVVNEIQKQPKSTPIYIELEGGSQSILWLENSFKELLKGYRVKGVRPEGIKAIRALPWAEKCESGNMYIVNESWADEFLKVITQFEGLPGVPLITDTGDAGSLAYSVVNKGLKSLLGT